MSGGNVARLPRKPGANLTARVERLEKTVEEIRTDTTAALQLAKQAADNSSEILTIMKGAKTLSVWAQKYGWRFATGIFGYAVAAGWINKGMADAARTIFGF